MVATGALGSTSVVTGTADNNVRTSALGERDPTSITVLGKNSTVVISSVES